MYRTLRMMIVITIVAVAMSSCSQEAEKPQPTAAPDVEKPGPDVAETGPDPTAVDADHYTTELENDRVRLVRITYGPGEESVMHFHPDSVAVFLTDHHVQFELPDGSTEEVQLEAGQHVFDPAGQHRPKNIGSEPLELVLVELKPAQAVPPATDETGPSATDVDPDHYKTEFENDRVRVLRIAYGPGEESTMHFHPDSVAVFLTDHEVQFTMPDGSTEEVQFKKGEQTFVAAGQHLPKNISDAPWELILVELKG